MRKFYIFSLILIAAASVSNAQVLKHFTEADTAVNSWWVNNGTISQWELTQCSDNTESYYALFTADLSLLADDETYGSWNWATDIKIDTALSADAQDAIDDAQSKLFLNFHINLFDGVNANDSLGFSFELATPAGGIGWPGVTIKPIAANEWNWVSVDLSGLDFSGITPGDAESISLIKFAIQPTKAYEKQDGMFKFGLQDIAVSKNALAAPAVKPCEVQSSVNTLSASALSMYPNPASSTLNFSAASSGVISDLAGRQVLKFTNTSELNIQNLKGGVYLVNVGKQTMKLIVE